MSFQNFSHQFTRVIFFLLELQTIENRVYCNLRKTRPAWAGFKTAEEGRAKICKFFMAKVEEQK